MKRSACVLGLTALLGLGLALGCGSSRAKTSNDPNKPEITPKGFSKDDKARCEWHNRTDREVSEATAAGAMTPNLRRVYQIVGEGADRKKVLICLEVDTNLDGVKDVMRTFNDKGEPLHEEADTNYDGRVDSWSTYANGRLASQFQDMKGNGKPDVWKYYTNGKLSRIQRDMNHDGNPDVWEIYVLGHLERVGVDVDFDGHVDRWDRDEMSRLATETRDGDKGSSKSSGGGADAGASSAKAGPEETDAGAQASDAGAAKKGKKAP
ncbi:MAG: hypothetical protein HY898_04335 [Deltaproteobacteria bacterium]|nr:hypothetical protein [Deltaproteobacteria bacterium]